MNVRLFTVDGLIVTLIHNFIFAGMFACFVFLQVKVLGNDLVLGESQATAQSRHR